MENQDAPIEEIKPAENTEVLQNNTDAPIEKTVEPVKEDKPVHAGGRPPIYNTPEELQNKINEFFQNCGNNNVKVKISSLAYHCGFESRQSFYDYEKKPEFSYTIKRAKLLVEVEYEEWLRNNGGAGAIFALKNFGWKDNSGIELSGHDGTALIPPTIIFESKKSE